MFFWCFKIYGGLFFSFVDHWSSVHKAYAAALQARGEPGDHSNTAILYSKHVGWKLAKNGDLVGFFIHVAK